MSTYKNLEMLVHCEYIESGITQEIVQESQKTEKIIKEVIEHLTPYLKVNFNKVKNNIASEILEDMNIIELFTELINKPLFNLANEYKNLEFKQDNENNLNVGNMLELINNDNVKNLKKDLERELIKQYIDNTDNENIKGIHEEDNIKYIVNGYSIIEVENDYGLELAENTLSFKKVTTGIFDNNKISLNSNELKELKIMCKNAISEKDLIHINNSSFNPSLLLNILEFYYNDLTLFLSNNELLAMGIDDNIKKAIILPVRNKNENKKYMLQL